MASIKIENVNKIYPNGFHAVHDMNLEIADGEFMVLVGPSGCGKTTALRMVAGLEEISDGSVYIGDQDVSQLPARERDIAMVFQNYALYPHLTVADNIGFPLSLRHTPKQEIDTRVKQAAQILGLTEWLDRKPGQLSGGQRQRVAMGRAIVREPAVFLMDEPLSNLDAKLRVQMRTEVSRIQQRLGVATMYVTHDQTEAMTMGDRVAVINAGVVLQCDHPQVLYDQPANVFVAGFMGSPAMNLYEATLGDDLGSMKLGSQIVALPPEVSATRPVLNGYRGRSVIIGIRPEDLSIVSDSTADDGSTEVEIEAVEALGSELLLHFSLDARRVRASGTGDEEDLATIIDTGTARVEPDTQVKAHERARLAMRTSRLHFFDIETELAISPPEAGARRTAGSGGAATRDGGGLDAG